MGKAVCVEAENSTVSSSQFCCEHKTVPKNSPKNNQAPPRSEFSLFSLWNSFAIKSNC